MTYQIFLLCGVAHFIASAFYIILKLNLTYMKYIFCLVLCLSFLVACQKDKPVSSYNVPQTQLDVPLEIVPDISSAFIDTVVYVKLQEPHNTFRNIDKLKILNDTIYLLDERLSKMMSFDKHGNYLTQYGERGKSESEYVRINSFDVDGRYVYMYDDSSEKMLLFTHDGQFAKRVKTPFWGEDFMVLDDGSFLFSLKPGKSDVKLCITDSLFNLKKTLFKFDEQDQDNFSNYSLFQKVGDSIYYTDDMFDTTYVFTSAGELVHSYIFNFGKETPPLEIRYDAEKLRNDKYVYMSTCPLVYGAKMIMLLRNRKARTVMYFDMNKRFGGNKDIDKDLSPTDIVIPLCMYKGYVVGFLEDYCLDRFADKGSLPQDVVQHLEKGYRVIVFYRLKH